MNIRAVLEVNLEQGVFGQLPLTLEKIGDKSVLEWTLNGLRSLDALSDVVVVETSGREEHVQKLHKELQDWPCTVDTFTGPDLPDRSRRLVARKWSLTNWRGGVDDTTVFCESENPYLFDEQLQKGDVDYLLSVPRCSPFVPLKQLRTLLDEKNKLSSYHFRTFPAPPGFHYVLYHPRYIQALKEEESSIRTVLQFSPHDRRRDPVGSEAFVPVSKSVRSCNLRFSCDFRRSLAFVRHLYDEQGGGLFTSPLESIVDLAEDHRHHWSYQMPRELYMSPGLTDRQSWNELHQQLEQSDDTVVNLDLTASDQIQRKEVLQNIPSGFWGMHVRTTPDIVGEKQYESQLLEKMDIVSFVLPAHEEDTYREITGRKNLQASKKYIELFLSRRQKQPHRLPLVTIEFIKETRNWQEEYPFYDEWRKRVDTVIIRPFLGTGTSKPEQMEFSLVPSSRNLCRKLRDTLYVEEDGEVKVCYPSRDASPVLGRIPDCEISEVWTGEQLQKLRTNHMKGDFTTYSPCEDCVYWSTP